MNDLVPSPKALEAIQSASVKLLTQLPPRQLRFALPCLSRLCFCAPLDVSTPFAGSIREIRKLICGMKAGSSLMSLMSVDFALLQSDLMKEKNLRNKLADNGSASNSLVETLQEGLLLEFERSEPSRRIRLVLSELLRLFQCVERDSSAFVIQLSGLFESPVYLDELNDVICIALAEIPSLLPIPLLTSALLCVSYGAVMLCRIVLNFPMLFEEVCHCIITSSGLTATDVETKTREDALLMLCQMNPSYCKTLRDDLVTACRLPGLAMLLSTSQKTYGLTSEETDLVPFVSGLLFTSNTHAKEWFTSYLKQSVSHASESMAVFRNQLKMELTFVATNLQKSDCESCRTADSSTSLVHALSLLRLYCGLKVAGYKISAEEADCLLNVVTCSPPVTLLGIRFAEVGLCTALVCTSLIGTQKREDQLTNWLEWLCTNKQDFGKINTSHSSFKEMLLLIAIHFHSNNLEAIIQLISSCLEMRLRPGSLTKMKILFTQQLFPEKVVAEHALTVEVTPSLRAGMEGYLPIHCVHQLLKSRAFTKHFVNVQDWIYRQLCSIVAPLHDLVVPLIEAFIHSIVMPLGSSSGKMSKHGARPVALDGFTDTQLLAVFKKGSNDVNLSCMFTTQLVLTYYVLLYQDSLLRNMKSLVGNHALARGYPLAVYDSIPIKHLLLKARADRVSYGALYPPLLRLVTTHYPHLCHVEDWMTEEELLKDDVILSSRGLLSHQQICTPDELKQVLLADTVNASSAVTQLSNLVNLKPIELVPYLSSVVGVFPSLLNGHVPRRIQILCCRLWSKLNIVMPNRLWTDTVNVLCRSDSGGSLPEVTVHPFTEEEIVKDPFIVLRCDKRAFRCPPVFDVVVRLLTSYLAASRAFMQRHVLSNPHIQTSKTSNTTAAVVEQERDELKNALIAAQESAVAQMLLEVCLQDDSEQIGSEGRLVDYTLREIRCRVCSYLHQVFISDPSMAKLIHFQGYPPELLSMAVAGIPSMHICLDFIPELLNMPQLEKQVFAVELFSYLAIQYPLPKASSIAQYVVSRFVSLVAALPSNKLVEFFMPATPCLVRICKAFPPLKEQCIEGLVQLGRIVCSTLEFTAGGFNTGFPRVSFGVEEKDQGFEESHNVAAPLSAHGRSSNIATSDWKTDASNIEELYHLIQQVIVDISTISGSKDN